MSQGHTRIIEKVRKLLALSQSDNAHEAAAAAAKAQELLAEHNLSMADVPAEDARSICATKVNAKTRQRLEDWAFRLAAYTAEAFDCRYLHYADGQTAFFGVGADPEVCAWTYRYLYKTLLRMGSSYLRSPQCRRLRVRRSKDKARASYLLGAVSVVGVRLKQQHERTPVTEGALVPIKEEAIRDAMPEFETKQLKPFSAREADLTNGIKDGQGIPLSTPLEEAEREKLS